MKNLIPLCLIAIICILFSFSVFAKTKKTRQVQEVNFSEMNLKGTIGGSTKQDMPQLAKVRSRKEVLKEHTFSMDFITRNL